MGNGELARHRAGGRQIELFTRSGNTETPDETWSTGRRPTPTSTGRRSPARRRGICNGARCSRGTGDGPVLTSVTAAYLQRNLRPASAASPCILPASCSRNRSPPAIRSSPVSRISRRPSASSPRRRARSPAPPSSLGRRTYQKGLQTLSWKADDENDDDLVYDVLYRREGETAWKTLRKNVPETILVWDTTTIPNGTYFVKIVASDSPSNPGTCAHGRARIVRVRDRQHAAVDRRLERSCRVRTDDRSPSTCKDDHSPIQRRRVLAGRPAMAQRVPDGRHRRFARGALRAAGRRRARRAGTDAARQRRDEQRGDHARRRSAGGRRGSGSGVWIGIRCADDAPTG